MCVLLWYHYLDAQKQKLYLYILFIYIDTNKNDSFSEDTSKMFEDAKS